MFDALKQRYSRSLALKLIVPLTVLSCSLTALGCYLMLLRLHEQMETQILLRCKGLVQTAELVDRIGSDPAQVQRSVVLLGKAADVYRLHVVDLENNALLASTDEDLVGDPMNALGREASALDQLDEKGGQVQFEHISRNQFAAAFRTRPGRATVVLVDCTPEHLNRDKIVFRRLTSIVVAMTGMTALCYVMLYQFVLRPAAAMRASILLHARGSATQVPVHSSDELGQVADSLNRLLASLQDRESHLRAMLESSLDCIITIDHDGKILEFNPAAEKTFGYRRQDVLGREIAETVIPESLRDQHRSGLARYLTTGKSDMLGKRIEVNARRSNGEEFPIELAIMPVRRSNPPVFTAYLRDITIRRRSQEALRESEQRFRMLADSAPVLIWMCDEQQVFNYFSKGWLNFTGRTLAHEAGKGWQVGIHLDDYAQVQSTFYQSIRTQTSFQTEFRLKRHDGQYRWMIAVGVPRFTAQGEFAGLIGTCTDVTERILAQQELERSFLEVAAAREQMEDQTLLMRQQNEELHDAREAAEAAARSKTEFLANMSHEIRTPMTAILGFADVLMGDEDEEVSPEDRRAAYETIKRNGRYLLELINDILDLSKIEVGKLTAEFLPCEPAVIVSEVVDLLGQRAAAKGLELKFKAEGSLPVDMLSDPTRLRQILVNLIGNAVKFTHQGGIEVAIRYVVESHSPWLVCDIRDTGIGMDEEQLARLFAPFTQADMSMTRRFGGTGLGLTISRRLARILGGDITVVSQRGTGSTFTLRLPITEARDLPPQMPEQNVIGAVAAAGDSSLDARILLAEDGIDNQRLLTHLLRRAGAQVTVVENGRAAVDAAIAAREGSTPFDLILMDMQMPVLDGYSATTQLREAGFVCPIVALTAHAMASDRLKCLDAGCSEYASKPIDRKTLIALVKRQLVQYRTQPAPISTHVGPAAGAPSPA